MKKPELLAPAGDMEKLKFALLYGADAVYLGGKNWSLRAAAVNFSLDEISQAVKTTHDLNKKLYVTVNILAHNQDLTSLPDYLKSLAKINVDGVIVSDPGILQMVIEYAPNLSIHLSTQANVTNWAAADFWHSIGVDRIVLARELSLKEIAEVKQKTKVQIEVFVHGAMCMAYSGRCLLSNYLCDRGANQGECAHPCRYKYYLIEEKRPEKPMLIEEDLRGSYILNSKDLCLLEYIPQLIDAGIDSFKIEGRMKSVHYLATVVKAYRQAIDAYCLEPESYMLKQEWLDEVSKVSHRDYTTGFYFDRVSASDHNYETSSYKQNYDFIGIVKGYNHLRKALLVEQRNNFQVKDKVEICSPKGQISFMQIEKMYNEKGEIIDKAPHPQQLVEVLYPTELPEFTILRKLKK